ncbi:hypothetical protein [Vagococcus zengguangii]|nr:hypothetical protein [Vagococcus zengguangii]
MKKKGFLSLLMIVCLLSLSACKNGISIEKQGDKKPGISVSK